MHEGVGQGRGLRAWRRTLALFLGIGVMGVLVATAKESPAHADLVGDPLAGSFGLTVRQQSAVVQVEVDGKARCTGVLVERRQVLTAKHCLRNAKVTSVRFGRSPETSGAISVKDIERHPSVDAALLHLVASAPATPIRVSPNVDSVAVREKPLLVGGFPLSDDGTEGARRFLIAHVKEGREEIIVGYEAGGLCTGDSGAPLLVSTPNGEVTTIGLLRGGAPSCRGPDAFVSGSVLAGWISNSTSPPSPLGESRIRSSR